MKQDIKTKALFSLFWKLMERIGTQGIAFAVQIVLARFLIPDDYGLIALIGIFIAIANVLVQSGFNTALIQKKDADETDFSSVLYLSIISSGIMYLFIFIAAPSIADFYENPQIIPVIRTLSVILFFGAFNSIQNAVIARKMQFKKLFFSSLGAILISGTIGIVMAYKNYGVWALVTQQLTNQLSITVILWFTLKWRPKLLFSFGRLKSLFAYGSKLLASTLLDTIFNNLRSLFIGKAYAPSVLGYYNRGQQFPSVIVSNIDGSIQSVMLPVLSSQQDNVPKMKNMVRRTIIASSFFVIPMMVGLAVVAKPIAIILLTDKWLPAVPFLQIYCFSYALWPIHTANLQAINALGRSDIFLKLEIVKKIISIVILGISIRYGVFAIAIGEVICGLLSTFINAFPNQKLLDYSLKEQFQDIAPSLLLSLVMGSIVYGINFIWLSMGNKLILQVLVGAIFYFGMSRLLKLKSYKYLAITVTDLFGKNG